ncbi:MAG: hypothetical protein U0903_21485 [Planctomycetales bacterium]
MNSRERILIAVLVLAFVGWQGWGIVDASLFEPLRRTQARARQLADSIDAKKLDQRRAENFMLDLEKWKKLSLPPEPVLAASVYQKWIIELAAKCQLSNVVSNPNLTSNQRPVADTYVPVSLSVDAKGTFDQIAEFIDRIRNTKLMQRIVSVTLSDPTKENPPKLTLSLKLEGLSFVSVPPRKTLFPDPQPEDPSPRSADYSDQLAALKKQVIFGQPTAVVVDDPAQYLILSATFPTAEEPGAWFVDNRQNRKQVVMKGKDFEMAGVTGKVADIGQNFVELEINGKKSQLRIGKSLKEVASGNPAAGGRGGDGGGFPGGGRGFGRGRRGGGMGGFDPSNMTPEERQRMMERFREMRERGGGFGPPGGGPRGGGNPGGGNQGSGDSNAPAAGGTPAAGGGNDNPFDLGF